jgi:hypothetical protein
LQRLNKALGIGAEKLDARWRDFYILWGNFEIVAEEVIGLGGVVAVEWPEMNEYWKQPDVIQFLKKFNFDNRIFHGCACSLVTRFGLRPVIPTKQSWRGSSNNSKMPTFLNERCDSKRGQEDHKHGDRLGGDCKATEDYTPAIIDATHMGFRLCCEYRHVRIAGWENAFLSQRVFFAGFCHALC